MLKNKAVKSAIAMLRDIADLFDLIYTEFQEAYNEGSPAFGRVVQVKSPIAKLESGEGYICSTLAEVRFFVQAGEGSEV